jgi:hypothetical protein
VYFSNEANSLNSLFVIFNMDPIVWLDGAKPANTSTPPSLPLEHAQTAVQHAHPLKIHMEVKKNQHNFLKLLFYFEKS